MDGLPNLEALYRESTSFPRAVAVAPWTLPSHESLLTGQYPWESRGLDAAGAWALPNALRSLGYRTALFSANPLLSELPGAASAFDDVFVSRWWEPFVRPGLPLAPNRVEPRRRREVPPPGWLRDGVAALPLFLSRFPRFLETGSKWIQRMRSGASNMDPRTAPWLEGAVDWWLRSTNDPAPTFMLVNLFDAHEPYLFTGGLPGVSDLGFRQDSVGWVTGRWSPSRAESGTLNAMYRGAVRRLDERVGKLRAVLQAAGRWDKAVVALTSDHGQAFGEHGMYFHRHRVDETLVRVPLWVRRSVDQPPLAGSADWVSHVDVPATLFREATGRLATGTSGIPLGDLDSGGAPRTVFAESEGLQASRARHVPPRLRRLLDRHRIAGYFGDRKAVLEIPGERVEVFDLALDPDERENLWPTDNEAARELVASVRSAMRTSERRALRPMVLDRIATWGYA